MWYANFNQSVNYGVIREQWAILVYRTGPYEEDLKEEQPIPVLDVLSN